MRHWTNQRKLELLLRLPWTVVPEKDEDDLILRVEELPSVIATGRTEQQVEADFWESLRATLETYLQFDDPVPKPRSISAFPWEPGFRKLTPGMVRVIVHGPEQMEVTTRSAKTLGIEQVSRLMFAGSGS